MSHTDRKKDLIKPDQNTGTTGSGTKNEFFTGIQEIGDKGYFPNIWKPQNGNPVINSFTTSGMNVNSEIKLLNNLNNICSMILKQVIYIPNEKENQVESQISKVLRKLSAIENGLDKQNARNNFSLIKRKLDNLIARPEFTGNKELLKDLQHIQKSLDNINLNPLEEQLETVMNAIRNIRIPDLDTTSIIDAISKLRTDIQKFESTNPVDLTKIESLLSDHKKDLNNIKDTLAVFNLKDLELAINHIADNIPKLKPLVDRQNAAHKILKRIAEQLGMEQSIIDAITIPEETEIKTKSFKIIKEV